MIQAAALTKLLIRLVCMICVTSLSFGEVASIPIPLFTPPKGWKENQSPLPGSRVKVSYFTKGKKDFIPSINLIDEPISSSLDDYLKTIQKLYEFDPENRFRKLGTLKTKAGIAHLISSDIKTPAGTVRVLQSIFLQAGTAYILTGAVLQEEFGKYQQELLDAFRSFSLEEDLLHYLKDEASRQLVLDQALATKSSDADDAKKLKSFKSFITKNFEQAGVYWERLLIQDMEKKLSKSQN